MRRRFIVLLHAAYWVTYLLLLAVVLSVLKVQFPRSPSVAAMLVSPVGFLMIAPNAASFYFAHGVVFPRWVARERVPAGAAAGAAGSLLFAGLAIAVLYPWLGPGQPVFSSAFELLGLLIPVTLVALLHAAAATIMRGFVTWYGDLRRKDELDRRTRAMEMALLRSRIDPHFLFNTLNNIDVLILKDPNVASEYLNKLSGILRFVLYDTREETIPLTEELACIEQYVALERIRSREPGFVRLEITGSPVGLAIAPMILIPIIENAFTHTDDRRSEGVIDIRIGMTGTSLAFSCQNRRSAKANEPDASTRSGGLGSELIQRRLDLLYPGRHVITAETRDDVYRVSLTLDLDAPPLHHR